MNVIDVVLVTTCMDWAGLYINGVLENETHSFDAADLIEWLQPYNGQPMSLHTKHTNDEFADAVLASGDGMPALLADIVSEHFTG